MKPLFHPQLVNAPFGDPALYVEFLFERRALLLDLGDIAALPPRKVLRVTDVLVSHTHMDHFVGFDRLLRLCLGRALTVALWGPAGFIDRVEHKLGAYTWNLVQNYQTDFTLLVGEYCGDGPGPRARFRCRSAFAREDLDPATVKDGLLLDEPGFQVRAAVLDHKVPCLGFALQETRHVNIWKNRLEAMGLQVGPWLRGLKAAVLHDEPDETPVRVWWREGGERVERLYPLGDLRRELVRIAPGQKLAYVVDAAYHPENARRVIELSRGADVLYVEATFLEAEAQLAFDKAHLTAAQAGLLAREAGVKTLVPFHFSARYPGRETEIRAEAERAFRGLALQ